jgi:hypothetical protein
VIIAHKKGNEKYNRSNMKNRDGSEANDHWETPEGLYKKLDNEFHFDFDPCPLHANFNGLTMEWGRSNFVNPPYNRIDKPKFINKAYIEWCKGKTCVLLIPASTGTWQFHHIILPNAEVRFLEGRVSFKGYNSKGQYTTHNKGKHDSMIVIFRGGAFKPKIHKWVV